MSDFVSHPLLKKEAVEKRLYQEILAKRVLDKGNTLIVAPTALGKTIVAVLVAADFLQNFEKKVLFLAPTKPLAVQHFDSLQRTMNLNENDLSLLTGTIAAKKRKEVYENSKIISATPQTIQNDIVNGLFDLREIGLIVFDECHRAIGDYAYVFICWQFLKKNPNGLVLGLTASPGGKEEKIADLCKNLFIKNIEIKNALDEDVKEYVMGIEFDWLRVDLPDVFLEIKELLNSFIAEKTIFLKKIGLARFSETGLQGKKEIIELQARLMREIKTKGKQFPYLFNAVSVVASILKVHHAKILIETQSANSFLKYLEALEEQNQKAVKTIMKDERIIKAIFKANNLKEMGIEHPKLSKLAQIIKNQLDLKADSRIIVFNHFRSNAQNTVEFLNSIDGIRAERFVGQSSKEYSEGMSQKQQVEAISNFSQGNFNVLVATSVAEEGLDIPSVDLVVFYEPVPSEIRNIQRRGRTGRKEKGKVIVLITRQTADETAYYSAIRKEKKMNETLGKMKSGFEDKYELGKQKTLAEYSKALEKPTIFIDNREQSSGITNLLKKKECDTKFLQLETADFVLSDRVAVERKTVSDFANSLIDGRLFEQLNHLKTNYDSPLLIIEGAISEIFSSRNIHKNALLGALSSIALDYNIPILFSQNLEETADYLQVIAKREQLGKKKDIRLRIGRKGLSLKEKQLFVIESLPTVGAKMARSLLEHFGSIKAIINSDMKDLQKVENLGEKKARIIKKLVRAKYGEEKKAENKEKQEEKEETGLNEAKNKSKEENKEKEEEKEETKKEKVED